MGADLILSWLACDEDRKLNWKAGHAAIDVLKADNEDGTLSTEGGDVSKESLHSDLKSLEEAAAGTYRDASVISIGRLNVLITGGMSWGDSPGETYETIGHLAEFSDILDAVGFDQQEDLYDYRELLGKILKNKALVPLLMGIDPFLDTLLEKKLRRKVR